MNESDFLIVRPGGNRNVKTAKEVPPFAPLAKEGSNEYENEKSDREEHRFGIAGDIVAWQFRSRASRNRTTPNISGFVKDQAGGVVAGAKVTVKSETKSLERAATTNGEGYFVITTLPPDFYTVTVEASGFKQYQEKGRKLDPNLPASIEVSLQPGQLTETVTVTASLRPRADRVSTVGKLVEINQVEKLQLNGRNPLFLAMLKPGVSGGALGQFSFGLTTGGLNINGSRTQDNLITFDGAVGVRTRSNGTCNRRGRPRLDAGDPDPDGQLQRRVWAIVRRSDPHRDQDRQP